MPLGNKLGILRVPPKVAWSGIKLSELKSKFNKSDLNVNAGLPPVALMI